MMHRRLIDTNEAELHALADEGWNAIVEQNDPPVMFRRGSELVYIGEGAGDRATLRQHNVHTLSDLLSRVAEWRRATNSGESYTVVYPPERVAKLILNWDPLRYEGVPHVERLTRTPFFACPDGTTVWDVDDDGNPAHRVELITSPGYHEAARVYYDPDDALADLPPVTGSSEHLKTAMQLVEAILQDFPFRGAASKTHALTLLLLPFVRELIDGDTPLYLITAPTPGTGKGLLTDVLLLPAEGKIPRTTAARDDEEWRKRITAELLEGPSVILFDNVPSDPGLNSSTMAAVLTAGGWWRDRVLGVSQMVTLAVRNIWVATGNNVAVSGENSRRVARIHLDRGVEDPAALSGFAIPNLYAWIREHRRDVVWAALTIIQSWLNGHTVQGDTYTPWLLEGTAPKQSYLEWSRVMGGIVRHVGWTGFMDQDDLLDTSERDELAEFFQAWEQVLPTPATSDEVFAQCGAYGSPMHSALPVQLAGARPDQLRAKVRYWLRSNKNRVAGGRQLIAQDGRPTRWYIRSTEGGP